MKPEVRIKRNSGDDRNKRNSGDNRNKRNRKTVPLEIGGVEIKPGERKCIELPAASLYTQTPMNLPVHVIRGKKGDGPCLFVTAAIHGDELNGVEVIRRLLASPRLKHLHGTLIAVPVVNVYGFISLSRYLPDRRDLNRSFPGSQRGSLASRLADLLMTEIISKCECGIDLHTGAIHRPNLPQIRVDLDTEGAESLAKAFNVPVILDSKLRDGSLRQAASELKDPIPILVFEGGEALRLDELSVRIGVRGVLKVMEAIGMLHTSPSKRNKKTKSIVPLISRSSHWVRAPKSGIIHPSKAPGDRVREGDSLGFIVDPFGSPAEDSEEPVVAERDGIIIGRNNLPLVNEGDALFHIASYEEIEVVESQLEELQDLELRPPEAFSGPDLPDS